MKKATIILIALLFVNISIFSQSKEMTFVAKDKRFVKLHDVSKTGEVYFVTGKKVMSLKSQKQKLYKFNLDLEKEYEINLPNYSLEYVNIPFNYLQYR